VFVYETIQQENQYKAQRKDIMVDRKTPAKFVPDTGRRLRFTLDRTGKVSD